MTLRQQFLKLVYPLFMRFSKGKASRTRKFEQPSVSLPSIPNEIKIQLQGGEQINPKTYNKKVLIVNTASDCGFTPQYTELQLLYEKFKDRLVIIAVPANDFHQQEKGDDAQIEQFCRVNYGVTFPISLKTSVVRGDDQHPLYQWLTDKEKNGWCNKQPTWNFSKYLMNEKGQLINYFDPAVSPLDKTIVDAITS